MEKNLEELVKKTTEITHLMRIMLINSSAKQKKPVQKEEATSTTHTEGCPHDTSNSSEKSTNNPSDEKGKEATEPRQKKRIRRCVFCKGKHQPWNCRLVTKERAKERAEILRAFKLCYKCFSKHERGSCKKDNCQECGGSHHPLLCYQKENKASSKRSPAPIDTSADVGIGSEDDWDTEDWTENYP